jgi:hypothetical protein
MKVRVTDDAKADLRHIKALLVRTARLQPPA